jgi:restriction endonuclease S subunit
MIAAKLEEIRKHGHVLMPGRYVGAEAQAIEAEPLEEKMKRLTATLPPLAEQRAIARILGALDDKIELNRKMNATLEAMARALFKSWFVDFDPVRAKAEGRDTGLPKHLADLFPVPLRGLGAGRDSGGVVPCSHGR